jgi:hypothetical protein
MQNCATGCNPLKPTLLQALMLYYSAGNRGWSDPDPSNPDKQTYFPHRQRQIKGSCNAQTSDRQVHWPCF